MKNIVKLSFLMAALAIIGCDQVNDEIPVFTEIKTEALKFHFDSEPVVFPIYGDFEHGRIDVVSQKEGFRSLKTDPRYGVTFVKYSPANLPADVIDMEVTVGNRIVGMGSVQVRKMTLDNCIQSAFSTQYVVPEGAKDLKINLISDVACDLTSPALADVRVIPVGESMGATISIEKNEEGTMDLFLNYSRLGCLKGTHEFVFELCLEPNVALGQAWSDPISNCLTYTTALAAFEVE